VNVLGASWQRAYAPVSASAAEQARARIKLVAAGLVALLALLGVRAVQLSLSGDPLAARERASHTISAPRADIVDRNGVLLATTVRAYALTATPSRVWDAEATAHALKAVFPDLDRDTLLRRLTNESRDLVYLRRGLTPEERETILALGLAGIGFDAETRRVYPQGELAAHALGFTDVDLNPLAGVERGLDAEIRAAAEAGRDVRLSLDVRIQHALEVSLAAAAAGAQADSGAAILLDGRTGETLALASWPSFDANAAGSASAIARQERVAGAVHEFGSALKPFTLAMALDAGLTREGETFDVSAPLLLGGAPIEDDRPLPGPVTLRDILAHSSNVGAAQVALRLGSERQRGYFERLGFIAPQTLQIGYNRDPIAPTPRAPRDVATLGFGYGLAVSPAALAGAYTVFINDGARVSPTLLALAADVRVEPSPVFSSTATQQVLGYLRAAVAEGTGRAADVPGINVAGKTGTAEIRSADGGYDEGRNFSSFAGVFPGDDPRYVIVLALNGAGEGEAGGVVAAPAVAHALRRIAPLLGLAVDEPQ
jgi:cell division protein FtsI (penicillin-binding protein 3)